MSIGTTKAKNDDIFIDSVLRPRTFAEYIGQEKIKQNLRIILKAAAKRKESVDHLLLSGQAGLGKTTLAHLIAKEMGAEIKITSGPAIERPGDLASILASLEEGDILFIDECHRLNRAIEEILYPAMESRKIHLVTGKGLGARMISLDLPAFTLIAATTRVNLLSSPLRSRFGAIFNLGYYSLGEIETILERSAELLKIGIESAAVSLIARSSRFTPRLANRLLKRARDFAEVNNSKIIDEEVAFKTLNLLEVDSLGLDSFDRRLLDVIIKKFKNRPVGINTLSAALSEERGVIEEIHEPYLIKLGLLLRTPKGRVATEAAIKHSEMTMGDER